MSNKLKFYYASSPYRPDAEHTIAEHVAMVVTAAAMLSNPQENLYMIPHLMFPMADSTVGDDELDSEIARRVLSMQCELIRSKNFDEIHVFNRRFSTGVRMEIGAALASDVPVYCIQFDFAFDDRRWIARFFPVTFDGINNGEDVFVVAQEPSRVLDIEPGDLSLTLNIFSTTQYVLQEGLRSHHDGL
jgi:hypothetical protein